MSLGKFTKIALIEAVAAIILWLVAFPTRYWSFETIIQNGKPIDLNIGLFVAEADGQTFDTSNVNPWLSTIVLESIGMFFALVALCCFGCEFYRFNRKIAILAILCSFISGLLWFVATLYYRIETYYLTAVGFSWYFAFFAFFLETSSASMLGHALRKGEIQEQFSSPANC